MRSLTKERAFDARVMMFLAGQDPQTVCGVAIGVNEKAEDVRASLHRLSECGQVVKIIRSNGTETFKLDAGGYSPEGDAA